MRGTTVRRVAAVLTAILATAFAFAPAAWLGDLVHAHGPVRLVHAAGTLWEGSAMIAISDGRRAQLVPGRVSWRLEWWKLLSGRMVLSVRHAATDSAVRIGFDSRALTVQAGEARVPAAVLCVLGAPFNTIRPGGMLHVRWDALTLKRDAFEGALQVDWEDAQSAFSPVAPLGNFRMTAQGRGARGDARLTTLKGPLLIEGQGSLEDGRIRFTASAGAQPEMRASLNGLIALLGRRTGDRAVLDWELQVRR